METNIGKKVIIRGDRSGVEFGTLVTHNGSKEEMERMSEEEKQRKGIKQLLSCATVYSAEHAGVRCAVANNRGADTATYYGFPLCFNSEEAALYAAHQFEDLFFQYYGIKYK